MTDVTVVVGTLDLYRTAWPVMCYGLKKYWADCPWPVVFITNSLDGPCGRTIKVGKDTGWTDRVRRGLEKIRTPVFLWTISDNWITALVDTEALEKYASFIARKKLLHVRLYPGWNHDKAKEIYRHDHRLAIFTRKSPYRCSLQPGLWDMETFLAIMRDGETPWDYERWGSKRSREYGDRFACVREWGDFPIAADGDPEGEWVKSPLVKGRWTVDAKRYVEKEGLVLDLTNHPIKEILDRKLRTADWVLP